mmetsp:Transcript_10545/g.27636  ORF Transcript_10545/g.27636 Transcript_10545/m.27636 type:complete len:444 (+) Transcript_10545:404-1735(+)
MTACHAHDVRAAKCRFHAFQEEAGVTAEVQFVRDGKGEPSLLEVSLRHFAVGIEKRRARCSSSTHSAAFSDFFLFHVVFLLLSFSLITIILLSLHELFRRFPEDNRERVELVENAIFQLCVVIFQENTLNSLRCASYNSSSMLNRCSKETVIKHGSVVHIGMEVILGGSEKPSQHFLHLWGSLEKHLHCSCQKFQADLWGFLIGIVFDHVFNYVWRIIYLFTILTQTPHERDLRIAIINLQYILANLRNEDSSLSGEFSQQVFHRKHRFGGYKWDIIIKKAKQSSASSLFSSFHLRNDLRNAANCLFHHRHIGVRGTLGKLFEDILIVVLCGNLDQHIHLSLLHICGVTKATEELLVIFLEDFWRVLSNNKCVSEICKNDLDIVSRNESKKWATKTLEHLRVDLGAVLCEAKEHFCGCHNYCRIRSTQLVIQEVHDVKHFLLL